jgi:predicted metal-dependent hydrolase
MMAVIRVGQTEISYELRRTAAAAERRITVTPGCVEVLALTTDGDTEIEDFLHRKRQWLFDTVRELQAVTASRPKVPRFMTGSKIPFRGRVSKLTVRRHDGSKVEIAHKAGFIVDLPSWVKCENADTIVATEIKMWLKQRARRDVNEIAAQYKRRFDLTPRSLRVAEFTTGWGSCGPTGAINIDRRLVFAPKRVLEYVVAHEMAHLKHRSHGDNFWTYLKSNLPDYNRPRGWLEQQSGIAGCTFSEAKSSSNDRTTCY